MVKTSRKLRIQRNVGGARLQFRRGRGQQKKQTLRATHHKRNHRLNRAGGIHIEPIQGKDVVKLLDYNNSIKQKISFAIIPVAIKKHRLIRASMLQDIEKGKPCEVEAINGVVSEYGRKVGVPTPVNDRAVEIIRGIEEGKYKPSFDNLKLFDDVLKKK